MKAVGYIAGLLGLALLVALVVHADVPAIVQTWKRAGAPLLWLIPYRMLFFALYAVGWRALLRPFDPAARAGYGASPWLTARRSGRRSLRRYWPSSQHPGAMSFLAVAGPQEPAA